MLFWSVFLKTHKKTLLTAKNSQNGIFESFVFKAESKLKHEEKFCLGVFLQNQKRTFSGVQNVTF